MSSDKYNFTVFGYEIDYFRYMFADVIAQPNVEYISDPVKDFCPSGLLRGLYTLHSNRYLNWKCRLPFQDFWHRYSFRDTYGDERPKCFVFLMRWLKPENEYLFAKLRRCYPACKIVVYLEDLVKTGKNSLDFTIAERYADLIVSYDRADAETYGFLYYPTFLSRPVLRPDAAIVASDICFCGAAKERYPVIMDCYRRLTELGYRCDFSVSRLSSDMPRYAGIRYIKRLIPYGEYLQHVLKTKCILELMQDDATGYTLRTWEAILFDKILLTNNKAILSAPFYNPQQFIYFGDVGELKSGFLREGCPCNDYADKLSPKLFLDFIATNLN